MANPTHPRDSPNTSRERPKWAVLTCALSKHLVMNLLFQSSFVSKLSQTVSVSGLPSVLGEAGGVPKSHALHSSLPWHCDVQPSISLPLWNVMIFCLGGHPSPVVWQDLCPRLLIKLSTLHSEPAQLQLNAWEHSLIGTKASFWTVSESLRCDITFHSNDGDCCSCCWWFHAFGTSTGHRRKGKEEESQNQNNKKCSACGQLAIMHQVSANYMGLLHVFLISGGTRLTSPLRNCSVRKADTFPLAFK